jgi:hypothetical protein
MLCPTNSTTFQVSITFAVLSNALDTAAALAPDGYQVCSTGLFQNTCVLNFNMTGTITATSLSFTGTWPSTIPTASCTGVAGSITAPCPGAACTLTN